MCNLIILLFPSFLNYGSVFFYYEEKSCSGAYITEKSWELEIKNDSNYVYKVTIHNSLYKKEKSKGQEYYGTWINKNDTLVLTSSSKNVLILNPTVVYFKKENKLKQIGFNAFFPQELYLKNSKNWALNHLPADSKFKPHVKN